MRLVILAVGGAALAAGSAVGAQGGSQPDPDEIVCKYQAKSTTRFKSKICHTRAEWAAIAERNKREYAEMRDRPTIETRRGG